MNTYYGSGDAVIGDNKVVMESSVILVACETVRNGDLSLTSRLWRRKRGLREKGQGQQMFSGEVAVNADPRSRRS